MFTAEQDIHCNRKRVGNSRTLKPTTRHMQTSACCTTPDKSANQKPSHARVGQSKPPNETNKIGLDHAHRAMLHKRDATAAGLGCHAAPAESARWASAQPGWHRAARVLRPPCPQAPPQQWPPGQPMPGARAAAAACTQTTQCCHSDNAGDVRVTGAFAVGKHAKSRVLAEGRGADTVLFTPSLRPVLTLAVPGHWAGAQARRWGGGPRGASRAMSPRA
jgi:hypothetical protein